MDITNLLTATFYIKIISILVALGCGIFSIMLYNRLRIMHRVIGQPPISRALELVTITLFVFSLALLTTLAIL